MSHGFLMDQPAAIHLARYMKFKKLNKTPEEIAKEEAVSLYAVRRSIQVVEQHRALVNVDAALTEQAEVVLSTKESEKAALDEALKAKTEIVDGKGRKKLIPDHDTRLRASEVITGKITAMQPRPGSQTNVKVGVGVNNQAPTLSDYATFEDRLRAISERRRQMLGEPKTVEATVEDVPAPSLRELNNVDSPEGPAPQRSD